MRKSKKLSERIEKKRADRGEPEWQQSKQLWSKQGLNTKSAAIPSAVRDTQLESYVSSFISDVETLGHLPSGNLMTPESARAAVYMINEKLAQLEKFKKTAEALKGLLLSHGSDEELN